MNDMIRKEKYRKILEDAIELEEERLKKQKESESDFPTIKWTAQEVHANPQTVMKLVEERLVDVAYQSSNSPNEYELSDRASVKESIDEFKRIEESRRVQDSEGNEEIPEDLFEPIVGYEDVKDMFMRSIKQGKVHIALVGEPGTAKTLFLEELAQLPNSYFIETGGRTSKAGLSSEVIFEHKPQYLMIDEITEMDPDAYSVLKPLMESGRVDENIVGGNEEIELETRVYATTNYYEQIPYEVRSRFVPFYFERYTHDEFIKVCRKFLKLREDMDNEHIARYVGEKVWDFEDVPDIRTARSVIRLLREESEEDVDRVMKTLRRYEVK